MKRNRLFSTSLWKGNLIDLWTIPHVMTGLLLALIITTLDISFITGLYITFLIAIIWELFELLIHVNEAPPNSIMDIIVAMIGYSVLYQVVNLNNWSNSFNLTLLSILFVAFVVFNIFGWVAYKHYSIN